MALENCHRNRRQASQYGGPPVLTSLTSTLESGGRCEAQAGGSGRSGPALKYLVIFALPRMETGARLFPGLYLDTVLNT